MAVLKLVALFPLILTFSLREKEQPRSRQVFWWPILRLIPLVKISVKRRTVLPRIIKGGRLFLLLRAGMALGAVEVRVFGIDVDEGAAFGVELVQIGTVALREDGMARGAVGAERSGQEEVMNEIPIRSIHALY